MCPVLFFQKAKIWVLELKQHYAEIGILCDLVSEWRKINMMMNTNPRSVIICPTNKTQYIITMLCVEKVYLEVNPLTERDRDTIHPIKGHCSIEMILKLLFSDVKSYIMWL